MRHISTLQVLYGLLLSAIKLQKAATKGVIRNGDRLQPWAYTHNVARCDTGATVNVISLSLLTNAHVIEGSDTNLNTIAGKSKCVGTTWIPVSIEENNGRRSRSINTLFHVVKTKPGNEIMLLGMPVSAIAGTLIPTPSSIFGWNTGIYQALQMRFKFLPGTDIIPWIAMEVTGQSVVQNFTYPPVTCVVTYVSSIVEDDLWPMKSTIFVRLDNPPKLSSPRYTCLLNGANSKCTFDQMELYEPWFKVSFTSLIPPTTAPVNITFYSTTVINNPSVHTSFLAYPAKQYLSPSTTTIGQYYIGKTTLGLPPSIPFYANINNLNSRVGMYIGVGLSMSSVIPVAGTPAGALYNLFTPSVKVSTSLQMKIYSSTGYIDALEQFTYTYPVSTMVSTVTPTAVREESMLHCLLFTNNFNFTSHAITSFVFDGSIYAIRKDFTYPFGVKSTPGQPTPFKFSAEFTYPNVTNHYFAPWPYDLEYQAKRYAGLTTSDITPWEFIKISSFKFVIRLTIRDQTNTGFKRLLIYRHLITDRDLVSGSLTLGVFEKEISYRGIDNPFVFPMNSLYTTTTSSTTTPPIDVSNGPGYTALYFNLSTNDLSLKPEIYFISPFDNEEPETWTGAYDYRAKMYVIPIKLNQQLFTRSINYNLTAAPYPLTYQHLYTKFGENAMLNVTSTYGDELGPIVSMVSAHPVDDTAFSHGVVYVTSSLDMERWSLPFTAAQLKNGIFSFTRSITGLCATQTLRLDVVLYDTLGNRATSQPTLLPTTQAYMRIVNTEIEAQLSILLTCQMTRDTELPVMNGFRILTPSVDVASINRTVAFEVTSTDSGVGLASDIIYAPKVFLMSHLADQIVIPCSGITSPYQCIGELPFGYGQTGVALSVYGIRDAHLNMAGYTTTELKAAGFPFALQVKFSANLPILESHSPITYDGGFIIIRGRLMGSQADTVQASIDYNGLGSFIPIVPTSQSAVSISFILAPLAKNATIKITVSSPYIDPDYSLLIDTGSDGLCHLTNKSLSTGAIVGIVAGGIVAIAVAIGATMLILKKRKAAAYNRKISAKLANQGVNS
eukprot:gene2331-2643_t